MMKNSGFARYFFGRYSNNFYFLGAFSCICQKNVVILHAFLRICALMRMYK